MSQGDYITFKKRAHVLTRPDHLDNTLSSQIFTNLKTYQIGKEIINTYPTTNNLTFDGKVRVFGIDLNVSQCPNYTFCQDTDQRPNRKSTVINPHFNIRKVNSLNGLYLRSKKNNTLCMAKELQACDEYLYLRRHRNKISDMDNKHDPNFVEHFSGERL